MRAEKRSIIKENPAEGLNGPAGLADLPQSPG
jgi:hypothetical protein